MDPLGRSFRAMNTGMRVTLYPVQDTTETAAGEALARAEAMVRAFEARFSRFLPSSELSLLNQSAGRWMSLSPDLANVLRLAREMHVATDGLFDPGVLPRLEDAGYDRSFEMVPAHRPASGAASPATPGLAAVEFDGPERARLPAGCRLDLGGIVKGWAADRVADWLAPFGAVLVDLGGDMAIRGRLPNGDPWCIGVEEPDLAGELLTAIEVPEGGVATSGTNRRHWRLGQDWMHHIMDPRTGR
ncbi:MAG: FAD:protein FMN transferase, partial [Chloroflexota bacterium]